MFPKGLGGLGDISGMFKQAMSIKDSIEELKETLAEERIEASAGGGMVTIVMNGKQEVLSLSIEPDLINPEEPEVLETLIKAAVNEANHKVQIFVKDRMTELTGGIDIPGITS